MKPDATSPHPTPRIPVRSLRVEVLDGDDRGLAHVATTDVLAVGTADGNDLVLRDPTVSRFHAEFSRTEDGVRIQDNGSTNGTYLGAVRLERAVVPPATVFRLGRTNVRVIDGDGLELELHGGDVLAGLRGRSASMRRLMAAIERAARSAAPVLVVGESGTGKELIARALHELSPRASGPLVTVDCGSMAPTLVSSELFGHEKGAFTGAERRHIGAFEVADGGTLFLDEVGELPAALQTSLLGALERRRFRRLGGRDEIAVDIRVVSATNRDLRAELNRGAFRLDLFYRLAVVVLKVPPLRERVDDVPVLVEHFLRESGHAGPMSTLISDTAMEALKTHYWPGNVRELRNLIDATLAMGEPPTLDNVRDGDGAAGTPEALDPVAALLDLPYATARSSLLAGFESRYLAKLLQRCRGNVSRAARDAKMDRSHLTELLRRHGLK